MLLPYLNAVLRVYPPRFPPPPVPCPPENIRVEEPSPGNCQVLYDESAMADFYMVFVKRDDGIENRCNSTGTPCNFTCTCGFTYFTTVLAFNPSGASPQGAVVNYTTSTSGHVHARTHARTHASKCTHTHTHTKEKDTNTNTYSPPDPLINRPTQTRYMNTVVYM